MINLDTELAEQYLEESSDHLAAVETCLRSMEMGGPEIDQELMSRAFRTVHSLQGGAGVFDLDKISELARRTEDVMALIRSREILATPERVRILLCATDSLHDLIQHAGEKRPVDIAETIAALDRMLTDHQGAAMHRHVSAAGRPHPGGGHPRVLLVEDDFVSRLMLQTFLARYGECHAVVNGREAVEAFAAVLERGERYDLICMDIMMPEMDGREAVRQIRALEEKHGILSTCGAKIIMTTAVDDMQEVIRCFQELCDGFLTKPIDLAKLLNTLRACQLVQ